MAFLVLFSALPLSFGVLRLLQLAGISQVMPAAMAPPLPLVLHIAGALVYALPGAFQFSPSIRRRWPVLHRASGRLSLAGALLVVVSALWLTAIYASPTVLAMLRVAVASAMALSIGLGLAAAIRRDIVRHRQWMIRAYALGLGSATQMLVLMAAEIVTGGPPTDLNRALLMGLAWGINLVVAERHIRRVSRGSQLAFRARTRCEPCAFRQVPQPPILNFANHPAAGGFDHDHACNCSPHT